VFPGTGGGGRENRRIFLFCSVRAFYYRVVSSQPHFGPHRGSIRLDAARAKIFCRSLAALVLESGCVCWETPGGPAASRGKERAGRGGGSGTTRGGGRRGGENIKSGRERGGKKKKGA